MKRADLVLHPVRLRIILVFARGRRLTPQQVAAVLPDVPQATLYRQIERLYRGGALAVAAERRGLGGGGRASLLFWGAVPPSPRGHVQSAREGHLWQFSALAPR